MSNLTWKLLIQILKWRSLTKCWNFSPSRWSIKKKEVHPFYKYFHLTIANVIGTLFLGELEKQTEISYINVNDLPLESRAVDIYGVNIPDQDASNEKLKSYKLLYGLKADRIHAMETAMELSFHRNCDMKQPRLWPNMPLKLWIFSASVCKCSALSQAMIQVSFPFTAKAFWGDLLRSILHQWIMWNILVFLIKSLFIEPKPNTQMKLVNSWVSLGWERAKIISRIIPLRDLFYICDNGNLPIKRRSKRNLDRTLYMNW